MQFLHPGILNTVPAGGVSDQPVGTLIARNSTYNAGGQTSFTFTPGEFPAHKVLVGVYSDSSTDSEISSVTVGSATATAVSGAFVDLATNNLQFYEATPNTGNNGQVVVTMASTSEMVGYALWSVNGLTAQAGNQDWSNSGTTVTLDMNTTSGDHMFGFGFGFTSNDVALNGITEQFDEAAAGLGAYHHGGYGTASGGTPEAFSFTRTGANTQIRGILARYS